MGFAHGGPFCHFGERISTAQAVYTEVRCKPLPDEIGWTEECDWNGTLFAHSYTDGAL